MLTVATIVFIASMLLVYLVSNLMEAYASAATYNKYCHWIAIAVIIGIHVVGYSFIFH